MLGTWELTEATDQDGNDILSKLAFPVTAIQITDKNEIIGTHSPLVTRLVYGDSKWNNLSAQMNQWFDYAGGQFSKAEYQIGSGTESSLTIEFKLEATASGKSGMQEILDIMGVDSSWKQTTVYHRFNNIKVTIPGQFDKANATGSAAAQTGKFKTMTWEFNTKTAAYYNYHDASGRVLTWGGWPVDSFGKLKLTWTRSSLSVSDIVQSKL
jgi:hypothetical protein